MIRFWVGRAMALQVFEEGRNLCLGLASRGIDYGAVGLRGGLDVGLRLLSTLLSNVLARCDTIAAAMTARGFRGPEDHVLHLQGGRTAAGPGWADAWLAMSVVGLAVLSYYLV